MSCAFQFAICWNGIFVPLNLPCLATVDTEESICEQSMDRSVQTESLAIKPSKRNFISGNQYLFSFGLHIHGPLCGLATNIKAYEGEKTTYNTQLQKKYIRST